VVAKQATKRKTVKQESPSSSKQDGKGRTNFSEHAFQIILIFMFTVTLSMLLLMRFGYLFKGGAKDDNSDVILNCPSISGKMLTDECDFSGKITKRIDFQSTIGNWVSSVGGSKGVIAYDLKTNEIIGEYNADKKYATASLFKLFVVYVGYLKVQSGEWDRNDIVGSTGRTVLDSLDLAIRESNSECAESLWSMIGRDELDEIVHNQFNLPDVYVGSFEATPREIMSIMRRFYQHPGITDAYLIERIKDSFLNQPSTIYNWRQGLPSGFSDSVDVYNKVGWEFNGRSWDIYDDTAILDFKNIDRQFIVVVMTNDVDFKQITRFGTEIEDKVISS
jgi:hypothetical protein